LLVAPSTEKARLPENEFAFSAEDESRPISRITRGQAGPDFRVGKSASSPFQMGGRVSFWKGPLKKGVPENPAGEDLAID
jgi:hypothetical protein